MDDNPAGRAPIVLVIDDDPLTCLVAHDRLEESGFRVHTASDGPSGLAAIAAHAPDIILLDILMPGLGGYEVCQAARLLPAMAFCPIVMLTALENIACVEQAFQAGATDFISKPIHWALLEHRLRFILQAAESLRAVARSDAQLAVAQRISAIGSWEWNIALDTVVWSDEMYRLCGASRSSRIDYPSFLALVHPSDRAQVEMAVRAALSQGPTYDLEFRLLLADGSERIVHGKADTVFDRHGQALSMSGTLQDITQRKDADKHIHYLANYDVLTGLPNRNLLTDRLTQALCQARRTGQRMTLLCLDLDGFKFVNDSQGHAVGDLLLKEVAARLGAAVRESDTVARVGGDEFVLIFLGLVDQRDVIGMVQKILDLFVEPFLVDARAVHVTASVGICLSPDDGDTVDVLLKNADVAMYAAKEGGRNCFRFYAQDMSRRIEQQVEMENALRAAVEQQQFEVHYQPKINLRTGKLSGVEALVRWNHPQKGMVQPDAFIPLAEQTGLIVPIGAWVLVTACAQAKRWQDMGHEDITVAVNLSAYQFDQQNVTRLVLRVLAETGLAPEHLELELTESMLMGDSDAMLGALRDLKAIGVVLTLDDFGTGYSSLSYLRRFPFDVIKIDRSFVRNVTSSPDDASLARTIVLMANSLKMKTVAEGVETLGQLGFLRTIKCDSAQGFYFSKPIAVDAVTAMLDRPLNMAAALQVNEPRRTVLLLDDEENVLNALARVFRKEDYQILQTTSAHTAFELLALHDVQVIISDQRMPTMSGTDFLSKVKEMYPDTIRIILSGYTEIASVLDAVNTGAVYRFFTKPWDDQFLRDQLRDAFEHHWLMHGKPADKCALNG